MARHPGVAATVHGLSDDVFSRLAARARARTDPVHPLHIDDTWMEPYEGARAEAQRTADHPRLHNYAPVRGQPELLEAIGAHLERRGGQLVDPDTVQVTSGATAGLSIVTKALLDPGEEVLLPAPFWPLIRGIINKRGARAVEVPLFDRLDRDGFDVEAALEHEVTPRTAAIYVNSPHNPTGVILDERQVAAIARVAERHDLWVFSDEVYEELYYDGAAPPPIWARADFQLRTIAVHSMSKAYGLAGARVGWAHGPPDAMKAIQGVQTFSTYCAACPMQLGAAAALNSISHNISRFSFTAYRCIVVNIDQLSCQMPLNQLFDRSDINPTILVFQVGRFQRFIIWLLIFGDLIRNGLSAWEPISQSCAEHQIRYCPRSTTIAIYEWMNPVYAPQSVSG